jgi:hypothetical protein
VRRDVEIGSARAEIGAPEVEIGSSRGVAGAPERKIENRHEPASDFASCSALPSERGEAATRIAEKPSVRAQDGPVRDRSARLRERTTNMKKASHLQSSTLDASAIQKLVEEAQTHIDNVARMTTTDKKRAAKLRRGAHQVLPLIAKLARKYTVYAPGTTADDIDSHIAVAQSLEPVLGAVAVLHGTLADAHMSAETSAWKLGTVSYAMMKKAGTANVNLANELAPVTEWFRQKAKGLNPDGTKAVSTKTKGKPKVSTTTTPPVQPEVAPSPAVPATHTTA